MAFLSQATSSWRLASSSRLPFRSMLLTLRGGPESLAPRAHQIPVSPMVFSTFLCRAFTAHRAIMVRDPLAIIAIKTPDGDRWTHHVLRHVARQTLGLRGDLALVHIGHQTIGVFSATPIHQLVDRLRLECLAHHAPEVPLPCATQALVGQGLEMLPARSLGIIPSARGAQMPMGMVRPMAAMRVEHRDGAPLACLPPDGTVEIVEALRPAAYQRAQHDRRVVGKGGAEHRWHREHDVPIDHPLVEGLAHLADPGIDMDCGAA